MKLRDGGVFALGLSFVACSMGAGSRLEIAVEGNGSTSPPAGAHTYASGLTVEVTATPASGAAFIGWSGAVDGTANPISVVVRGDEMLVAVFTGASGDAGSSDGGSSNLGTSDAGFSDSGAFDAGSSDGGGAGGTTVSINAGGDAVGTFLADAYYSGGSSFTTTNDIDTSLIAGGAPPAAVFQAERYGEFTYTLPSRTPSSAQTVTLYFEESYWTSAGQRTFDVSINGAAVLTAFDIFDAAGGQNKAIAKTFSTVANSTGQVVIQFSPGAADQPKVCGITVTGAGSVPPKDPYTASWASVDKHTPAPEWFQDAKFGIYYHWGAFGVAEYGSEWYPRNLYNKGSGEYNNQVSKYGDPFGDWPYDKFLTGANDKSGKLTQFAPKLVSDGGNWDPDAWAQLFADAGAKFAGPVAEHHDGFSMWDSKVNEWNSVSKGPQLNLLKLQADAIRKKGLKLLAAMHHAYNFTGYYQFAPTPSDPSLQKLYGKLDNATEQQLWVSKLKEVVDMVLPDILWEDFNLSAIDESKRLQFLSYYYNAALAANVDVVATYKDGFNTNGEVLDYERGGPGDISTPYWLTDDAVSPASWCYVQGMSYYSDSQEVHSFIDHVSKGGNLLLNISPLPDGTIPPGQKDLLGAFGSFLKQSGEAIYSTRAWTVYGEGPTKMGGGSFTQPTAGTANDVRYTQSKDGDAVYAILLGWPGGGKQVNLSSVTTSRFSVGSGKVFLFGPAGGSAIDLAFTQDGSGLHVTLPSTQPYTAVAYAMKISKSGNPPASSSTVQSGRSKSDVPAAPRLGASPGSPALPRSEVERT